MVNVRKRGNVYEYSFDVAKIEGKRKRVSKINLKYHTVEAYSNIVKNIQNVGGNILGVVYNRAKQNSKEYNQKYYYAEANTHDTSARRNRQ